MGKYAFKDSVFPESYNKVSKKEEEETFYNGVAQCVLHFSNGKYKVISNDNANDLLAVNVVSYNKTETGFVELVLKHYKEATSLDDLAIRCGYNSTKTFTRHFKQKFNTTPKQWQLSIRKNEVIDYLENTDYPLKKIASLLGFTNVSHLRDFCIKKIGLPPDKIRKLDK